MNEGLGIAAIVAGALLGLLSVFVLWTRLPAFVGVSCAVGAGVVVGAGALLVQDAARTADWVVTLAVVGGLTPLHAKLLFGRPGKAT